MPDPPRRVDAINEELVWRGLHLWLLAPQSGVWKLLGQPAGRTDVKLRPVFASGLPGPRYGQKTNLEPTSGDLWVWANVTSDDRWVQAGC